MPKITRKQERKKQREHYLSGTATSPHTHSPHLRLSLEEASSSSSCQDNTSVCLQCYPVLTRYTTVFKEMVHTGTELKKRRA